MQPNESINFLANQDLPLPLNCFAIGDDGRLVKRLLSQAAFRFSYDDTLYHVAVRQENKGGIVEIWTDLGGAPYSAEGVARRSGIAAILQAARGLPNLKLSTDKKQRLLLSATGTIASPVTAQWILATVTMLVTQTKPWLDVLALYDLGKGSKGET